MQFQEDTIDLELLDTKKNLQVRKDKRKGYFETVNGGTIFLDEIMKCPLATRKRLLVYWKMVNL